MINFFKKILVSLKEKRAEHGFTTAELIGNAALSVAALALLWKGMREDVFPKVFNFILDQLGLN